MQIFVDVKDFKSLEKEFLKVGEQGKAYLADAVNKAGQFTHRSIKTSLPIHDKNDGIHLRDSVKQKKQKINKRKVYQASLVTVGDKKRNYAIATEFGRKKRTPYKGLETVKKTLESNQNKIADIIIGVLTKRLGLK